MPLDLFLDSTLGQGFVKVPGDARSYRAGLLGPEPERVILEAFADLAPHIGSHAAEPRGPAPVVEAVADMGAFKAKVEAFQALGYTVRVPQPRWLSPGLGEFLAALEFLLHKPATAEAFWSRGDAKAPVHHDNYDIIVVQLRGRKRWFISTDRSELQNDWESVPKGPPILERYAEVEVGPGDLLYIPRGTQHRVDALADSLHLSIGFVPLTVREAVIAVLDHLSDLDRPFRESVGQRLASSVRKNDFGNLSPKIRDGVARLLAVCRSDDFVAEAMQRRSSRTIKNLKPTSAPKAGGAISVDTVVQQGPSAICHMMANADKIDFSHPGGHIYIHRGVEESLKFVAETPRFRVSDLPGAIGDDVRVALVEKLITAGFLDVVA